jgi:hypothetical protein
LTWFLHNSYLIFLQKTKSELYNCAYPTQGSKGKCKKWFE